MFRPAEMMKVRLLVLEKMVYRITERLGQMGILHLSAVEDDTETAKLPIQLPNKEPILDEYRELKKRSEYLLRVLEIDSIIETSIDLPPALSTDEIDETLIPLEEQLEKLHKKEIGLNKNLAHLKKIYSEMEAYANFEVPLEELNQLSFLHFVIGSVEDNRLETLRDKLENRALVVPFKTPTQKDKIIAITTRKGRFTLETALGKVEFKKDELNKEIKGIPSEIVENVSEQIREIEKERDKIILLRQGLGEENKKLLLEIIERIHIEQKILQAEEDFGRTESTYLIYGWIPKKDIEQMKKTLIELTGGNIVIEVIPSDEVTEIKNGKANVPVKFQNPKWLKPFEMLISAYGIPGYKDVEPTLLVAISFLLMFGIMFGDVGQGLVFVLIGLGIVYGKHPTFQKNKNIGMLLIYAGGISIIFGFLYGSVFGNEELIPHLWISPLHNINTILLTAISFGVVLLSLGLIINIINLFRKKNYLHAILDRTGLMGLIFYWSALRLVVYAAAKYIFSSNPETVTIPLWQFNLCLILAPTSVILFYFREPLYNLITRKGHLFDEDPFTYFLESMIEVMELFISSLANTVSFARIGAFALSHAGLCGAFYTLKAQINNPVAGVIIIILGNILVIILEGMVVTIQAIRLEYYEFFNKFFKGEGREYKPFNFKKS